MPSLSALPRNQHSVNAPKSLSAILGDRNGNDRNGSRTVMVPYELRQARRVACVHGITLTS